MTIRHSKKKINKKKNSARLQEKRLRNEMESLKKQITASKDKLDQVKGSYAAKGSQDEEEKRGNAIKIK